MSEPNRQHTHELTNPKRIRALAGRRRRSEGDLGWGSFGGGCHRVSMSPLPFYLVGSPYMVSHPIAKHVNYSHTCNVRLFSFQTCSMFYLRITQTDESYIYIGYRGVPQSTVGVLLWAELMLEKEGHPFSSWFPREDAPLFTAC